MRPALSTNCVSHIQWRIGGYRNHRGNSGKEANNTVSLKVRDVKHVARAGAFPLKANFSGKGNRFPEGIFLKELVLQNVQNKIKTNFLEFSVNVMTLFHMHSAVLLLYF
jgi:hypothetical protein